MEQTHIDGDFHRSVDGERLNLIHKPNESGPNSAPQSARLRFPAGEATFVLGALLFMAILSIGSIRSESLTTDELVHIPAGLAYWQKRDTRLNVEHPPLLKMIAAVPLLFANVNVNYDDPSWCGKGGLECERGLAKSLSRNGTRILSASSSLLVFP